MSLATAPLILPDVVVLTNARPRDVTHLAKRLLVLAYAHQRSLPLRPEG
ncbi:MAG: hypothetical protein HY271_03740 [Deltaproteobacteria bacterium]|nr:hypothetical protein [Deltaproteobacteria bacterium]